MYITNHQIELKKVAIKQNKTVSGLFGAHFTKMVKPNLWHAYTITLNAYVDFITYFKGGSTKPTLKIGHGWVITFHCLCGCDYMSLS